MKTPAEKELKRTQHDQDLVEISKEAERLRQQRAALDHAAEVSDEQVARYVAQQRCWE